MSKFKCNITYKKIPGNSLLSTQNKLRAHGFVDIYWNVKVDVATWREARSELNELASTKLGSKVNLFEEKKLLNGIRAVPVVKYFSMIDRMKKTFDIPISQGVSDVYDGNKELQSLGTKQEYANYVNSIFPNSKIKDVVYHGTNFKFDKFSLNNFGNSSLLVSKEFDLKGISVSGDPRGANFYGDNLLHVLINTINPATFDQTTQFNPETFDVERVWKNYDSLLDSTSVIFGGKKPINDTYEIVIKDPDQIHILGNNTDIENFSKWNQKYQPQFVRDELGVDEITETNLDSKSTETLIYESIGQRKNSVIKEENISNVRKQIEEFNNKPYGKKLSLVEVKGGWIINSTFTSNYLYSGAPTELDEIEVESKTTDSNRNFNVKCITG